MANTVIQLKYSTVNDAPISLNIAEPAYSYTSGNLFIGNTTSTGVIVIGGKYFTDIINAATNSNTPNTLVKRDSNGSFSANVITATLDGNATTATTWQTARNIGVSGEATGAVSVDGSADANIAITLSNTGVTAGAYGNSSEIPVITVAANGRVTNVTTSSITTSLQVVADNTANTIDLATDKLTLIGGDGIDVNFTSTDNVTFAVDNTVFRTSGGTITGDLSVTGNLSITGNTSYINVTSYQVDDPLIYLAANNYSSDIVDIGFAGNYYDGATQRHTGIVRKAATNEYYVFVNYDEELDANNTLNIANPSLVYANVHANIKDGTLYNTTINSLASDLEVKDGGTGASSFTSGKILIGNGTGAISELSNSSYTATNLGAANTINSVTVDSYGRTTAVSTTPIAIDTSQVTSGTLSIARGGTNQTTFTTGQRVFYDGSSLASLVNVTTTATGTLATSNTITSLTFDDYGGVTAYTSSKIAIAADQVTSGTLAVARGGTGLASYAIGDIIYASGATTLSALADVAVGNVLISGGVTTAPSWGKVGLTTHVTGTLAVGNGGTGVSTITANAVVLGQGTSAITTVGSSTEGHILTINSGGVPTFSMLSGGTF